MSIELSNSNELVSRLNSFDATLNKINFGIDIDQTEIATNVSGVSIVNRIYNTAIKPSDLTYDYAIVDIMKQSIPGLENPRQTAIDIWNSDENLQIADPMPGALVVSKHWADKGITRIHRITQRPHTAVKQTHSWYKAKMPWVDRSLIHIQDNNSEHDELFKAQTIKDLDLVLFIENSVPQAKLIEKNTRSLVALIPESSNLSFVRDPFSRILVVPKEFCPALPAFVRLYYYLAGLRL